MSFFIACKAVDSTGYPLSKKCWGFADLQVLLSSWLINLLDTSPPETPGVRCVYCYNKQKPPLGQVTVSKHINL